MSCSLILDYALEFFHIPNPKLITKAAFLGGKAFSSFETVIPKCPLTPSFNSLFVPKKLVIK